MESFPEILIGWIILTQENFRNMIIEKLKKIALFYWFAIVCSLYNTIQYLAPYPYLEIKAFIVPVLGNLILLFCCFVHWILPRFVPKKALNIMDRIFIVLNCILLGIGVLTDVPNLFTIWVFSAMGLIAALI